MPRRSPARSPRIIDCHNHVGWYGYDADRLVANMDEHGIDVTWLLTWEAPAHEFAPEWQGKCWPGRLGMPLEDVLEAARRYPGRFIPFFAPDPRRPDALARLEGAVKHLGVRGCGELKCRVMMDDPNALAMFHFCGERGLPVIFHMDVPLPRWQLGGDPGYWYCCDWENLARALDRCPKTVFLGHGPGFWREISGNADADPSPYPTGPVTPGGRLWRFMERHANLYCDLSAGSALNALRRDPALSRGFLRTYQDRVLFGRDFFDGAMAAFLRGCRLGRTAMEKLLLWNALRLVPLKAPKG